MSLIILWITFILGEMKHTHDRQAIHTRNLNRVVEDGVTVPQVEPLNEITGAELFAARSYCGVLLLPCGGGV